MIGEACATCGVETREDGSCPQCEAKRSAEELAERQLGDLEMAVAALLSTDMDDVEMAHETLVDAFGERSIAKTFGEEMMAVEPGTGGVVFRTRCGVFHLTITRAR